MNNETEKKETEQKCLHNFVPVEADNKGESSVMQCTKCGQKFIKG